MRTTPLRTIRRTEHLHRGVEAPQREVRPLIEQATEPEEEEECTRRVVVREEEKRVLEVLKHPHYKMRSISGIAVDARLSPQKVQSLLQELMSKGLVMETPKTKRQGIRWAITSQGVKVLESQQVIDQTG